MTSRCRRFLRAVPALLAALLPAAAPAQNPDRWYRDYFTMYTMPHLADDAVLRESGCDAYRASTLHGGWYGAWYLDWQKTTPFYKTASARNGKFFKHHIMYFDGGEVGDFMAFVGPDGSIPYTGWTLQQWKGQPPLTARWFGFESFFQKNSPFPFPNYEHYGLQTFTWPDGKPAESAYDVVGRRDVDGKLGWNEPGMNDQITDEMAEKTGLAALSKKEFWGEHVVGRNGWITVRQMTQDYANPQLRDYQAWEIGHLTREVRPSGWHIDNLGDNNLYRPFQMSFGAWSEHTHKQYLREYFKPGQLAAMGIPDLESFDIKAYFREHKRQDTDNIFVAYDEPKWKDDPVFKTYIVNHALRAAEFHRPKYDAVKQAAREAGIDCMVSGNLVPLFPGYTLVKGSIDVCHFEWPVFREYQPDRRIMGFPPQARSGYITRLAAAMSRENYSIVSLYIKHDMRGREHENLHLAQAFEALPNRALLDYGHQYLDYYSPGTPRTEGIYRKFITAHRRELSRRDFTADVAVVYDQWAEIASSTACQLDIKDFFNEYAGWCDFLADTHRQWKVVLSGDLAYENIKDLPVIILPSAISLTDANFAELAKYLQNGGRVLATGETGLRFGPEGHTLKRPSNPLDEFAKYPGFRRITNKPAAPYWLSKDASASAEMAKLLDWPGFAPALETTAGIHAGVTLSHSLPGEPPSLSLDLNNNNFDVSTDRFTATQPFRVTFRVPPDFAPPFRATVAEPDKPDGELAAEQIRFDPPARTLTLEIAPFEIYRFLRVLPAGSQPPASEHAAISPPAAPGSPRSAGSR